MIMECITQLTRWINNQIVLVAMTSYKQTWLLDLKIDLVNIVMNLTNWNTYYLLHTTAP